MSKGLLRDNPSKEYLELKDAFGSVPLFAGTAFIAFIAMCVAVPIVLFSGIYLAEYASTKVRKNVGGGPAPRRAAGAGGPAAKAERRGGEVVRIF